MTEISRRLEEIARSVFGDDSLVLSDSTKAADVAGWDSLGHVNFMYGVETEFDIQFSDDEFVGFENVGELSRMIQQKVATRRPA